MSPLLLRLPLLWLWCHFWGRISWFKAHSGCESIGALQVNWSAQFVPLTGFKVTLANIFHANSLTRILVTYINPPSQKSTEDCGKMQYFHPIVEIPQGVSQENQHIYRDHRSNAFCQHWHSGLIDSLHVSWLIHFPSCVFCSKRKSHICHW